MHTNVGHEITKSKKTLISILNSSNMRVKRYLNIVEVMTEWFHDNISSYLTNIHLY